MEEPEVPTEHLHEAMEEGSEEGPRWTLGVALSSALLAGFAAVASLNAGHYANEPLVSQIKAANQWSFFQSKSIKESQLKSKIDIFQALGKEANPADKDKMAEYGKEKGEIQKKAEELEKEAEHLLHTHHALAISVTMFQIAIAMGAISALTKRKRFWMVSLGFGVVGLVYMVLAWLMEHPL